eukprot:m.89246 g.89246  ORF g.89246 m.89246 type:complete len:285 (-) comp8403_c1_seq1:160-1014(-)
MTKTCIKFDTVGWAFAATMHARSVLLLRREWHIMEQARAHTPWGVSVRPSGRSLLEWEGEVRGLSDSPFEEGIFQIKLTYPVEYDAQPPHVQFITVPFHPNIDPATGVPCIDWLASPAEWLRFTKTHGAPSPDSIALALQHLLSDPHARLDEPVNMEAAVLLTTEPMAFARIARQCVLASVRVHQGLPPYDGAPPVDPFQMSVRFPKVEAAPPVPPPPERATQPVSFEEYHREWLAVGTTNMARPVATAGTRGGLGQTLDAEVDDLVNWAEGLELGLSDTFDSI